MMSVAETILSQLGGNQFIAMTGAKAFVEEESALRMRLPRNFAKDGINFVCVKLESNDTYTVRFCKIGNAPKFTTKEIAVLSDVYAHSLRNVFTMYTGLAVAL